MGILNPSQKKKKKFPLPPNIMLTNNQTLNFILRPKYTKYRFTMNFSKYIQ